MKFASYRYKDRDCFGLVVGDGLVTLSNSHKDGVLSLKSAIAAGRLQSLAEAARESPPDVRQDDVAFLPVIPDPGKIIAVGLNFHSHRQEVNREETKHPVLFTRFAGSQIGHLQPIVRPLVSSQLDYEGEVAVVIGTAGRHVDASDAFRHVAGYACYNDGTLRDWQRHTHQFTPGKNFSRTGPFGPWLVTPDEVPDLFESGNLTTRLNGVEVQRASLADLIFPVSELIAYITTFIELEAGDVVITGTPGGVGFKRNPPLFMKAGDVVEVEISGLGVLRNSVVDEVPHA